MNELNMRPTTFLNALWLGLGLWAFASCALIEDKKEPGWEYAPQMYVSTPYEPYSQVTKNTIKPMVKTCGLLHPEPLLAMGWDTITLYWS